MTDGLKVGDVVRAFHPAELGVVRYGTIVKIGWKYVHVDFGEIRGGVYKIFPSLVVSVES